LVNNSAFPRRQSDGRTYSFGIRN